MVDQDKCAFGFTNGKVVVYDIRRLDPTKEGLQTSGGPHGTVLSLCALSPAPEQGPTLLAAGYFGGAVTVWTFA